MAEKTIYYEIRERLKQIESRFKSRMSASEHLGIGEDRLGDIETGVSDPKPDEIVAMVNTYNTPELYNHYCSHVCAIGKEYMPKFDANDLDLFRVTMQFHNAITDIELLEGKLMKIADDGVISEDEEKSFQEIMMALDSLAARTTALKLWAHKNFKEKSK